MDTVLFGLGSSRRDRQEHCSKDKKKEETLGVIFISKANLSYEIAKDCNLLININKMRNSY